jgi:hypothetical protein
MLENRPDDSGGRIRGFVNKIPGAAWVADKAKTPAGIAAIAATVIVLAYLLSQ